MPPVSAPSWKQKPEAAAEAAPEATAPVETKAAETTSPDSAAVEKGGEE
jgi:hypothetical protein